ncbi:MULTISPECIES: Gp37 family protein [unclassified Pseudomonas]|uniref:Gp37 family protein n=1 Tax=unclassified Pseudomonas TaxID=196821 RepID=UPI002160379E|nr:MULTISPECIES: Gp37 family protein [unclassified Pseudomonas]UVM52209.1 Gp37 family protein [Pseudomonas sp. B21-015]WPN60418.1 Gp37 family protein [Pseudomonas sp. P9_31]
MSVVLPKTQTEQLLEATCARLQEHFSKELMVELFPENPAGYRLNHPRGSILLAYGKSTFGGSEAGDSMFQARNIVIRLTLVFRQLNGKDGVISYLDQIRACLTGWFAPHCDQACRPVAEQFIGQMTGLWQYGQDFALRATQIQAPLPSGPPLPPNLQFEETP